MADSELANALLLTGVEVKHHAPAAAASNAPKYTGERCAECACNCRLAATTRAATAVGRRGPSQSDSLGWRTITCSLRRSEACAGGHAGSALGRE